ncbi:MAG: hypothetical protein MUF07_04995 [Steroidobacteraceae bacterium]|jgi:hypothetical protein|nr:hypothetical protein [Steroidobacteraceae bacterium]
MTRSELEHVLRAAGAIADDDEIVVVGSQSILGQFPDAPAALLASMEADVYPRSDPQRSELIDGAIGEGSLFHERFGYYAQGVDDRTATLPHGWQDRLVRVKNVNTGGVAGLCLEVHDLAISKYVAGRPKDVEFTRLLAQHGLTHRGTLLERLRATTLPAGLGPIVAARIARDFPA